MNINEFELFVLKYGKDILRFCRMTTGNSEAGDELYQDTMLKLTEKRSSLDFGQNVKSYALSISIYLWKNKSRKYANRKRLLWMDSIEELSDEGKEFSDEIQQTSPEQIILHKDEINEIQKVVISLPQKYKLPIYLFYSADMQIREIADILHLPEGTVKSRMRKAKKLLKEKLEALGYDG
ncbi:MAG: sigma-70 family RNA polymerase sigma factor [Lachnospiraceae bacterium]|nr:sigma-70 family RNA polymerase sigma factor [Lachnospiraceae bacterium]